MARDGYEKMITQKLISVNLTLLPFKLTLIKNMG